jgi:hypothetical protein
MALTNFTLRMESIVGFAMQTETHYQGTVSVGSISFPFDISGAVFENPTRLEEKLKSTQMSLPGVEGKGADLVSIVDKNRFKRVLEYLRKTSTDLPWKKGYRNLGWTWKHDMFITPLAAVDVAGLCPDIAYYPDAKGDHHCYGGDMKLLPPPGGEPAIPPELAELVSGLVAQSVRYFNNLKVRPIPILNNEEGRRLGLKLFRGFGQKDLFRSRNYIPSSLELNRGMPCLIANLNELQAAAVYFAGAYLSDKGLDLKRFSEEEIDDAAGVLSYLTLEISRRLLTGEPVTYKEMRSVRPLSAVATEGANMIRADFWKSWPHAGTRWATVDRFLLTYENRLGEVASVDNEDVVISKQAWEGIDMDPVDLNLEHGLICEKSVLSKDSLRVDRSSFYRMVGDFYGDVPKLPMLV